MRKKDFWTQPFLRSCVRSDKVHWPELLLGYFLRPLWRTAVQRGTGGIQQRLFYDVLGISGPFLVIFPMVSSVLAVVMNLAMGVVVDRTHTAAGKARAVSAAFRPGAAGGRHPAVHPACHGAQRRDADGVDCGCL